MIDLKREKLSKKVSLTDRQVPESFEEVVVQSSEFVVRKIKRPEVPEMKELVAREDGVQLISQQIMTQVQFNQRRLDSIKDPFHEPSKSVSRKVDSDQRNGRRSEQLWFESLNEGVPLRKCVNPCLVWQRREVSKEGNSITNDCNGSVGHERIRCCIWRWKMKDFFRTKTGKFVT